MHFTLDFANWALYLALLIGMIVGCFMVAIAEESTYKVTKWIVVCLMMPFIAIAGLFTRLYRWVDRQTSITVWVVLLFGKSLNNINQDQVHLSRRFWSDSNDWNPIRRFFVRIAIKAVDKRNRGKILNPA